MSDLNRSLIEKLEGLHIQKDSPDDRDGRDTMVHNVAIDSAIAMVQNHTAGHVATQGDVERVAAAIDKAAWGGNFDDDEKDFVRDVARAAIAAMSLGDGSATIAPVSKETDPSITPARCEICVVDDGLLIGMLQAARPDVPQYVVADFVKGKAKNLDYLTCDMAEFRRIAAYLATREPVMSKPVSLDTIARVCFKVLRERHMQEYSDYGKLLKDYDGIDNTSVGMITKAVLDAAGVPYVE